MKNNQKGNITLLSLLLFFLISFIGLNLIQRKLIHMKKTKNLMQNYLCMKEYTGEIKRHNEVLEVTNLGIKAANAGKVLGFFTSPTLVISANKLKSILKKTQTLYHFSFLKKVSSLYLKDCKFSASAFKTNYLSKGFGIKLERDKFGVVKKREKKWKKN